MNTKINEISYNTRQHLRPTLTKHKRIHNFTVGIHNIYCKLTGGLHLLPDFYILGAAKSGTSSLYEYLIQHPSIHSAFTKEPRFFDKYYFKGLDWYKVQFPTKFQKFFAENLLNKKFMTGESTVRYLDHPFAPERIKKATPNAKFIILLRNPIDRAFSHYTMMEHKNKEDLSFDEAILKESERTREEFVMMEKDANYYSSEYYHHAYLDRGIYYKKIEKWFKVFPKEQFLIIQSEEFFKNPNEVYQQIIKFLGLPDWKLKNYSIVGPGKYKKQKISNETRKKLTEFFKPHNERLFELLHKKFDWINQ
ncbi:MAG: sulfotransferase [Candidatus Dadabacteria bacterium]|nr:sulfotransferase [Candidatus Dadabacteria bacterium]